MKSPRIRSKLALGAVLGLAATGSALAATGTGTGPSTTTDPYMEPVADGVKITSLLTVENGSDAGQASNGYQMVGIPDGLGAFGGPKGDDFGLIMNQELRGTQGVNRRHGVNGAFDSVWRIDPKTLEVEEGADLIDPTVRFWDYASDSYTDTATAPFTQQFNRFCSGYLSQPGQLFNEKTGRGYDGQLYFANEENGDIGRLFGVTLDGQAQQLPRAGLFSWENTLVGQNKGDTTYIQGQEDGPSDGSELWVYVGQKLRHGNPFDRAGLTNGHNFVVDLADEAVSSDTQFRATYGKNNPARFDLGSEEEVDWNQPGADQNAESKEDGLALNRIEDGAFDPRHPEDFYFVTTAGGNGATSDRDGGGIWRLSYDDVERPWEGGTLTLLLDGSETDPALWNPDNVGFDKKGHLLIQEDPGNNPHRAKIVAYDVDSGDVATLAEFDTRFEPGSGTFITQDEESSGIISASRYLGSNTFLFDAQIHLAHPDADKVEHGQLMTMHVQSWRKVFAGD
jgi:uncharacterized protein DUF839